VHDARTGKFQELNRVEKAVNQQELSRVATQAKFYLDGLKLDTKITATSAQIMPEFNTMYYKQRYVLEYSDEHC